MSVVKSTEKLNEHKEQALKTIDSYLTKLIESDDVQMQSKADKLSYWFDDYINFLGYEPTFDPTKYPKYKKGQIIKVHLGFNIGSEEGGLHYAIVIENKNAITSPTLNIVPLTSVKPKTDISRIRSDLGRIYLGNELYRLLDAKIKALRLKVSQEMNDVETIINTLKLDSSKISSLKQRVLQCQEEINTYQKLIKEISKMKLGSIALVGQITTISKIRIYNPKNSRDVLSGIRMSDKTMDMIDESIKQLFTKR